MGNLSYVELRCKSAFSFLAGASLPEELVRAAAHLEYPALALGDQHGVYGIPRFHQAAQKAGIRAIVGAEVSIAGYPLLLLCQNQIGYRNLCRLLTKYHLLPQTNRSLSWDELETHASGLFALTGGREGGIGQALYQEKPQQAALFLDRLCGILGPRNLAVELQLHFSPSQDRRNQALLQLAQKHNLRLVVTNDVRFATQKQALLYDMMTCLREKTTFDQAGTRLLMNREYRLKSPQEMAQLFSDLPHAITNTLWVAEQCSFTLSDLGYNFPTYALPQGETALGFLQSLVAQAASLRFDPYTERVRAQLARELHLIGKLKLEGYFLIVWDIIQFCRSHHILVQGRGSAANSAVCFALGITACDPVKMDLLFERFLSEERGEWPDIDLDLPSGEGREQVIQYLFQKYGAHGCALTANVITYRARSAVRDVGKTLGFGESDLSQVSRFLSHLGASPTTDPLTHAFTEAGFSINDPTIQRWMRLSSQLIGYPRHLGQHPGGMVLCAGRLDEIVPIQPATMPGRALIQWDKEDCARLGLIKIDLLGLGMLKALEEAIVLCAKHDNTQLNLAHLPPDDPAVYQMLSKADTVGVFQVESRAQMVTLTRMKPRCFYDLVVEVALIRPGPIAGKMVNPYLQRRAGKETVTYPHESLRSVLARTLGIPLFQEQVMRAAMVAAGFSGTQAEALRRAIGFKRNSEEMEEIKAQLCWGMNQRSIPLAAQQQILAAITSFTQYGFPESHAISFALIVYASAYVKVHHPAILYTSLLNAWPMGFYHPAFLVRDAMRHGVEVLPIDVNVSQEVCSIEDPAKPAMRLRLGLNFARGLRKEIAKKLVLAREPGRFSSLADLRKRCHDISRQELTLLAEIGALSSLERNPSRRTALWQVSALSPTSEPLLEHALESEEPSPVPEMTIEETISADLVGTSVSRGPHPLSFYRHQYRLLGYLRSDELASKRSGTQIQIAGLVVARQRPQTAKGFVFLTGEDEAGFFNVIVNPQVAASYQAVLLLAPSLLIEGILQKDANNVSIKGIKFQSLDDLDLPRISYDWH